jgi:HEAT repeat protein
MIQEHLEQLARFVGPSAQSLFESQEATERRLDDPDPKMRWAAVTLMTYHWGAAEQFKAKCEWIAFHDPDPLVRSKAIGCLGFCFSGTSEQRIESILADVVSNDSEDYSVRRSAYISLLRVNGAQKMPPPASALNLRIPEDVDWAFVRSVRE